MSRSRSMTGWVRVFTLTAITITAVAGCTGAGAGAGAGAQAGAAPAAAASGAASTAASALEQTNRPDVTELTTDTYAARSQHDVRTFREFRRQLLAAVGADAVARAHSEYLQVVANVSAASRQHDPHMRAIFVEQLQQLCTPPSLSSVLEDCGPIS